VDRALAKVPFLHRRLQAWQNLDGSSTTDVSAFNEKTGQLNRTATHSFFASSEKQRSPSLPGPGGGAAPRLPSMLPAGTGTLMTNFSSHQPGLSFSSVSAAQFATMSPSEETATLRSRMADPFFNQSELARQPSDAYDPGQRQVNRASELSSLSSGFGDGDIIIPQPPPPTQAGLKQTSNFVGRFSWMSKKSGSNRDTIYTETSEDSPARFRSVSSWVNQQTGRLKRAQQREPPDQDGDVPPVPDILRPGVHQMPPEQPVTMAVDTEEPRRADTIPGMTL